MTDTGEKIRGELEITAIELYEKHANEYQTIVVRYSNLLKQVRRLKIARLHAIPKAMLKEFPEIRLLSLKYEEAIEYVAKATVSELSAEVVTISAYSESVVLTMLRSKIVDFQYVVNTHDKPRSMFGFDPNYHCSCHRSQPSRYSGVLQDTN